VRGIGLEPKGGAVIQHQARQTQPGVHGTRRGDPLPPGIFREGTQPPRHTETDAGDGFRESGFSKERRLEPQITIGLLADQSGFPLMVSAFEGNKAETKTMLPVIQAFMTRNRSRPRACRSSWA
jgi:hypothetical protein